MPGHELHVHETSPDPRHLAGVRCLAIAAAAAASIVEKAVAHCHPWFRAAKRKGREAAAAGDSITSCPYPDQLGGSRAFRSAWLRGYNEIASERLLLASALLRAAGAWYLSR